MVFSVIEAHMFGWLEKLYLGKDQQPRPLFVPARYFAMVLLERGNTNANSRPLENILRPDSSI